MWAFTKKAKIERLKRNIKMDKDLSDEQKNTALIRLEEKERSMSNPFGLDKLAQESQSIFENLLPDIVGKVQVKRLQTRNEMIREMRTTLDELAETKKSWVRLKNIDAEIAYDQMIAYKKQQEEELTHQRRMAELERSTEKTRDGGKRDKQLHELDMKKIKAQHEDFDKRRAEPESKEKTIAERIEEENDKQKLRKVQLENDLELKNIDWKNQQARKQEEIAADKYEAYKHACEAVKASGLDGEALTTAIKNLDQKYGFDQDYGED